MSNNDSYSREKERLEEIILQTRSKDVPLEKSLDLYDEAIAIGARCVEQLEKTDFTAEELDSLAEHPEVELSGRVTEHPEVAALEAGAGASQSPVQDDAVSEDTEEFEEDEEVDLEELDDDEEDDLEEYDDDGGEYDDGEVDFEEEFEDEDVE